MECTDVMEPARPDMPILQDHNTSVLLQNPYYGARYMVMFRI